MREIKFRAWDKRRKEMYFPEELIWNEDHEFIYASDLSSGHVQYDEIELMQFTGLKDKNRKEIYEDDVVKCEGGLLLIQWKDNLAHFHCDYLKTIKENIREIRMYNLNEKSEVLGNIYENPELLRGVETSTK